MIEEKTYNQEKEPLVSIILPTYNVEEYLQQSIESIINQTYKNLEIIFVNDGSSDQSVEIIERYMKNDARINLLNQDNLGVSAARNNGLNHATGKYVIFWDPDDYFALNAIECLVLQAEKTDADVCVCNASPFISDSGKSIYHPYIVPPFPDADTFSWRDCPNHIFFVASSVPWNKLVRHSLLKDNDIRFREEITYLVDNEYMVLVMCYAKRITVCKKKLIYYRMNRPNSVVQTSDSNLENVVTIFRRILDELNKRNLLKDNILHNCFLRKTASMYNYRLRYYSTYEEYENLYHQFLLPISPLCEYDSSYGRIQQIEDMSALSAGDYLLKAYKNIQSKLEIKQQELIESRKEVRTVGKEKEKMQKEIDNLIMQNSKLKLDISKIKVKS